VFKGTSAVRSELAVAVSVGSVHTGSPDDIAPFLSWQSREASSPVLEDQASQQQQQ
jgi:hypothetical protein